MSNHRYAWELTPRVFALGAVPQPYPKKART
jgi:hypothetical protein